MQYKCSNLSSIIHHKLREDNWNLRLVFDISMICGWLLNQFWTLWPAVGENPRMLHGHLKSFYEAIMVFSTIKIEKQLEAHGLQPNRWWTVNDPIWFQWMLLANWSWNKNRSKVSEWGVKTNNKFSAENRIALYVVYSAPVFVLHFACTNVFCFGYLQHLMVLKWILCCYAQCIVRLSVWFLQI